MRPTITPIILEKEFIGKGDVKGFKFTQIASAQRAYVYEIDSGDNNTHYEVFLRKSARRCIDFEKRIYSETEFKEYYPRTEYFGAWAWTYNNIEKAYKKFLEL